MALAVALFCSAIAFVACDTSSNGISGPKGGAGGGEQCAQHVKVAETTPKYIKEEATCDSKAVYFYHCSVCDTILNETFEHGEFSPNHNYMEDGICRDCGLKNPSGVKALGPRMFDECVSLISVSVPSSVDFIGYQVFRNCTMLQNVTFAAYTTGQECFLRLHFANKRYLC